MGCTGASFFNALIKLGKRKLAGLLRILLRQGTEFDAYGEETCSVFRCAYESEQILHRVVHLFFFTIKCTQYASVHRNTS